MLNVEKFISKYVTKRAESMFYADILNNKTELHKNIYKKNSSGYWRSRFYREFFY